MKSPARIIGSVLCFWATASFAAGLTLSRENNWLIIHGPNIPSGQIRINYLEAYCRANSTDADWVKHTMIRHTNQVLSVSDRIIKMRDTLADGVIVDHTITASDDEVVSRWARGTRPTKFPEALGARQGVRLGVSPASARAKKKDISVKWPNFLFFTAGNWEHSGRKAK